MIRIEDINNYGFVFHEYDHKKILKDNDEDSMKSLSEYISSLIKMPGETLYADVDVINFGESIPLHYHIVFGSFQVVVWDPTYNFDGRFYLYGTSEDLREYKPRRGMMCFMKPNDPNFIHGVSPLLSYEPVKSYGFTSSLIPLPEKNDIFI